MQLRYTAHGSACSLGHIHQCARFAEPPGVHGRGERLEICVPGQFVVEAFKSFGGVEQLQRGVAEPGRTGVTPAAACELHLGAQPSRLGLLEVGQRREFGDRKQLVRRLGRRRVPFGLRGRERPCTA